VTAGSGRGVSTTWRIGIRWEYLPRSLLDGDPLPVGPKDRSCRSRCHGRPGGRRTGLGLVRRLGSTPAAVRSGRGFVDALGDPFGAVLQGGRCVVVQGVDDQFADPGDVARGRRDQVGVAGVGEDRVGVPAVVGVRFAADEAPLLQAADEV
jgi:hypothetical protein